MNKRESIINVLSSIFASGLNILITLFAQRIFLQILDIEYLGINGLFSNIISLLGIFELGIGTAIIFNLYEPLAKGDKQTTVALMQFYKKAYRIIACIVGIVGISITPFLHFFIKEIGVDVNIHIVYMLFVANIVCSYLLSYRRNILYADRKNYQISIVHAIYLTLMNILQLTFLAITKNYYIFLVIKILMQIAENAVLYILAGKQYPFITTRKPKRLNKIIEKDIFKKVRALFLHKIGGFVVLGTDNILISKFIGLIEVGLYSNYYIVINAIYTVVGQAFSAFTPSVGHALTSKDHEQAYSIFTKTRFLNFALSYMASLTFLALIQPFVSIWLGKEYLLDTLTIIILAVNVFQRLQRYSYNTFKEAAGIFHEDRFVPIIESTINIVASLILLKPFGIAGIFMGTALSDLSLWCFSYPKFVYKKIFHRSYPNYIKETLGYFTLFVLTSFIVYSLTAPLQFNSIPVQLIYNSIIVLTVPPTIFLLIFRKNNNLTYLSSMSIKILQTRRKH